MTPYRAPAPEPEAEVLFRAKAGRLGGILDAVFGRKDVHEVRLERVAGNVRLVVADAGPVLRAPFVLDGASRVTEGRHRLMRLVVSDASGARVSIGGFAREEEDGPPLDDWFDGARLGADEHAGDVLVESVTSLWALHATILTTQASSPARSGTGPSGDPRSGDAGP